MTKKIFRPPNAKPIWARSAAAMFLVLEGWRRLVPEAPWWASLIVGCVVLVLAQLADPSPKPPSKA